MITTVTDNIERFLYWAPPTGFPDNSVSVNVNFEVGGAYEDWGWEVKRAGKIVACHKNLATCLKMARQALTPSKEEKK